MLKSPLGQIAIKVQLANALNRRNIDDDRKRALEILLNEVYAEMLAHGTT